MKVLLLLLTSTTSFAAGGAGHISDLAVPAGNFILVFGFILWKIKGPLKRMFDENAVKVKELVELAEEKDKEAQIRLDIYEKKMSNLNSEVSELMKTAEVDANNFESRHVEEVEASLQKMTKDAHSKIESEKSSMLKMLNASLLDEVIKKAKTQIASDKSLNKKTTDSLLSKL